MQVMQRLIDLEALQPTGDLSAVYSVQIEYKSTNYLCFWPYHLSNFFYLGEEIHSVFLGHTLEPNTRPAADSGCNWRGVHIFNSANVEGSVLSNLISISSFINSSVVVWQDLFAIAQDQPFRFPSTFTFVLRAFSTLEG